VARLIYRLLATLQTPQTPPGTSPFPPLVLQAAEGPLTTLRDVTSKEK